MQERKERTVSEGNAFYEIDLECLKKKKMREQKEREQKKEKMLHGQK